MTARVAVVILSHRAPDQLRRLVRRVGEGGAAVPVVHHDPGGEPLTCGLPGALRVPAPVRCGWGRPSIVIAVRRCLGFVRAELPEVRWTLLVSGQDYPLRPLPDIAAELAASPYDAYLRHFPLGDPAADVHPWQAVCRRRYLRSVRIPGTARALPLPFRRRQPWPPGTTLYAGGLWANLSTAAVAKVLDSPLAPEVLHYLRRAPIPDEAAVPTLALNGAPALRVAPDNRRYVRWDRGSSHPRVLGPADLEALSGSDAFFARKLDLAAHPGLADRIDDLASRRRPRARTRPVTDNAPKAAKGV
ncbi:MAG: hypothetical protein GEV11_01835 [Streptosporangiales bacterium]|nr:hypothetical protein [Streptosporangiales bacterium]